MGYRNIVLSLLDEAAERVAAAKKSILSAAEGNPGGPDVWSCWAALLDAQRKITEIEDELLESCGEPRK